MDPFLQALQMLSAALREHTHFEFSSPNSYEGLSRYHYKSHDFGGAVKRYEHNAPGKKQLRATHADRKLQNQVPFEGAKLAAGYFCDPETVTENSQVLCAHDEVHLLENQDTHSATAFPCDLE